MRIDMLPTWARTALKNGPVFGSEGEEGSGAGDGGNGGAGNGNGQGNAGAGTGSVDKPNAEENQTPQLTESQIQKIIQENASAKTQLAAYEQEKQERIAADEEAERATRSKEENLTKDVQRLTEANEKMKIVNERNLLDLAILRNKTYEWHDANDVAALLDRTGIKIDAETGKVEGVEDALKSLAKAKPHLLKPKADEGNGNGNGGNGIGGITGGAPSGGKPGTGDGFKANKRKELENRFNVLKV